MRNLKLERPWDEVKELMIEVAPELSAEDLDYVEGEEEELIEKVAKKMNRTPEHVKSWIESVSHTNTSAS